MDGVTAFHETRHQTITELGWWSLWTRGTFSLTLYEDWAYTLSFGRLNFSSVVKISSVNKIFLTSSFFYKCLSTFDMWSLIRFKPASRRCLVYFLHTFTSNSLWSMWETVLDTKFISATSTPCFWQGFWLIQDYIASTIFFVWAKCDRHCLWQSMTYPVSS